MSATSLLPAASGGMETDNMSVICSFRQKTDERRKKRMKRFIIMAAVLLLTVMAWNATIAEETLHPVIMISEVMASNDSVATYPNAGYTDWVEICNSGDTAVDLSGWGSDQELLQ